MVAAECLQHEEGWRVGTRETQDGDEMSRGRIWSMVARREFLAETGKTGMSGKSWAGEDASVGRV